ncbi:MAG: hypothetical protein ABIE68_01525 [bacterium]
MNDILLKCNTCEKIFSSGIAMTVGSSATFENNKSQCAFCGSMESIPDGTFKSTVKGIIKILNTSENRKEQAEELYTELKSARTKEDLTTLKGSSKLSKFKNWIPDSPEKIAAYLIIIQVFIQLCSKSPEVNIEYNNFVSEYNIVLDNDKESRK